MGETTRSPALTQGERRQCIGKVDHGLGKPELQVRSAGEAAVPWLPLICSVARSCLPLGFITGVTANCAAVLCQIEPNAFPAPHPFSPVENFPTDPGAGGGFRMIQAYYIYCVVFPYYYYYLKKFLFLLYFTLQYCIGFAIH